MRHIIIVQEHACIHALGIERDKEPIYVHTNWYEKLCFLRSIVTSEHIEHFLSGPTFVLTTLSPPRSGPCTHQGVCSGGGWRWWYYPDGTGDVT